MEKGGFVARLPRELLMTFNNPHASLPQAATTFFVEWTIFVLAKAMFTYQKTDRYFGQISEGLEELGCQELNQLGAADIKPVFRGVFFSADKATMYRIIYVVRLFTRILAPLIRFDCHSTKYLYKTAKKMEWPQLLDLDTTFAINANVVHSKIRHSQYAALCVKDAIVDFYRERFGKRPNIDTRSPDLQLNLHVQNDKATIYVDVSGGSMHRRGYRRETIIAPMQETVAAAIIRLTGWNGEKPLVDPMCGSGTLVSEALMHYCRIPSGFLRQRFGIAQLPDFDEKAWQSVKMQADKQVRELPTGLIRGSDSSRKAVKGARANNGLLPQGDKIHLTVARIHDIPGIKDSIIVSNPPYGMRMGAGENMALFMKELGDFLKQRCKGSTAYLYFGNRDLIKKIGLRPSWKRPLKSGGLDGRLVKYELF